MLNKILRTKRQSYKVHRRLDIGGQGETFVVFGADGVQYAAKVLFPTDDRPHEIKQRIDFLVGQRLDTKSPLIAPAVDTVVVDTSAKGESHCVFSPMRKGIALETYMEEGSQSLTDHLSVGAQIAHATDILHTRGIAHGDLHTGNILIHHTPSILTASLIDLDNFAAAEAGAATPRCLGQLRCLPPEIRRQLGGEPTPELIGVYSDRYALAVLMHELLLFRHPGAAFEDDPESFGREMSRGYWPDDPCCGTHTTPEYGLPAGVLDSKLAQLMRCGLDDDPERRPSACAWQDAMRSALERVYCCDHCGRANILDTTDTCCPSCRHEYTIPALRFPDGDRIILQQGLVMIGREQVGSPYVSRHHIAVRRLGPLVEMIALGENGTWVLGSAGMRESIAQGEGRLIVPGQQVCLADTKLYLEHREP